MVGMNRHGYKETQEDDDLLLGSLEYMKEETVDGVTFSEEQVTDILETTMSEVSGADKLEEDTEDDDILEGEKRKHRR